MINTKQIVRSSVSFRGREIVSDFYRVESGKLETPNRDDVRSWYHDKRDGNQLVYAK